MCPVPARATQQGRAPSVSAPAQCHCDTSRADTPSRWWRHVDALLRQHTSSRGILGESLYTDKITYDIECRPVSLSQVFCSQEQQLHWREQRREPVDLLGIETALDVAKDAGPKPSGSATANRSGEAQRFGPAPKFHGPVGICSLNWVTQQDDQLHCRIVLVDARGGGLPVSINWRRLTGDLPGLPIAEVTVKP